MYPVMSVSNRWGVHSPVTHASPNMIFFKDPIYFRITSLSVYITNNDSKEEKARDFGRLTWRGLQCQLLQPNWATCTNHPTEKLQRTATRLRIKGIPFEKRMQCVSRPLCYTVSRYMQCPYVTGCLQTGMFNFSVRLIFYCGSARQFSYKVEPNFVSNKYVEFLKSQEV